MGGVEPNTSPRSLPLTGRTILGVLLLCVSLCAQPGLPMAEDGSVVSGQREVAAQVNEALIPVATDAGIRVMAQRDYEVYVRSMGHLPVLSKVYVFGRSIPQPQTDRSGHIHLSAGAAAAPVQVVRQTEETLVPVATNAGVHPMLERDYEVYVRSMGHLPVMSKAYVFGRTIAKPKTDKLGHIHLSAASRAASADVNKRK